MTTFANVQPVLATDGITYSNAVTVPSSEADLFNQTSLGITLDPIPVLYGQAIVATVNLIAVGTVSTNSSYVILQMALDALAWFDMAWITWTGLTAANESFLLSAGSTGAAAFQQSRASGTTPQGTEFNQAPLAGKLRFVGQSTVTGGGSVTATIAYKMMGLR